MGETNLLWREKRHSSSSQLGNPLLTQPYPGLAVDMCLLLQQKLDHLDVAVVTGHVQRSVSHLGRGAEGV